VNQTIAGLACGKPIRGHVAFLGGPLHFLSELRGRFIETLKLTDETTIIPENSHLFAAYGTAVSNKGEAELDFDSLLERLENGVELTAEVTRMDPLFEDEEAYEVFKTAMTKIKSCVCL
jgi:activator of 2-hydroxyglutaryl-CoA dehydratase